jgi:hypothetical protein
MLAGCGSDSPIWEVSETDGTKPASCYPGGKLPQMVTTTMGVETSVGPWEIYDGSDNKAYLLLADKTTVLDGTKSDGYAFQGTTTTTDTVDPPVSITTTSTMTNIINIKMSGDTLSGTWEVKTMSTCSGANCGMMQTPSCDVTGQIKGSKLNVNRYRVY